MLEPQDGFHKTERALIPIVEQFGRTMTAALLSRFDMAAATVRFDGVLYRNAGPRQKTYHTLWGKVGVRRRVFVPVHDSGSGQLVPLERRAGLINARTTPAAARAMAFVVQSVPGREAQKLCQELGVLPYSHDTLDKLAKGLGRLWEEDRERYEDRLIEALEIPERAHGISVAVDRVQISVDETPPAPAGKPAKERVVVGRMAYCASLTLHDKKGEPLLTRRYGRMPHESDALIREQLLWDTKNILGRRFDLDRVALSDGGVDMQGWLDKDFPDWTKLCDFYHLSGYLGSALGAVRLTLPERAQRLDAWKHRLSYEQGAAKAIVGELRGWKTRAEAVHTAIGYMAARLGRMDYATVHARGLPIGSGHVEATCKQLVTVRMKRTRQRWTVEGAQNILNLRTLATSDLWEKAMDIVLKKRVEHVEVLEEFRRAA
ncbi:MAG: hypothetical protein H0U74_20045 [Bradymonadaceae bacterium]|nr:hypothetical protein [Lujinxingiaceae bacterium]